MRRLLPLVLCAATAPAFALSCGDAIERDVKLVADLDCSTSPEALQVLRSGVTIDLNGHRITGGVDTSAIALEGVARVTVRGPGRIEGAAVGVDALRAPGLTVSGIDFVAVGDGVRLTNSAHGQIVDNRFERIDGHAVAVLALPYSLTRGGSHMIRGNSIVDSEYGVLLGGYDSGHSLVAGNSFAHIGTFAIQADPRADWSRIDDNRIDDVGVAAIAF
jgi:hypothetical protein